MIGWILRTTIVPSACRRMSRRRLCRPLAKDEFDDEFENEVRIASQCGDFVGVEHRRQHDVASRSKVFRSVMASPRW